MKKNKMPLNNRKRTQSRKIATVSSGESNFQSSKIYKNLYQMYQGAQPHGHTFETANSIVDNLQGNNSKVLKLTTRNSPDRVNTDKKWRSFPLQDKICKTPAVTERELFENNRYRYIDPKTGKYFPTVVAKDQYEAILKKMDKRILKGHVPGLKKGQSKQIIKSSAFTYRQIYRASQVLTPESLVLDVTTGFISSLTGGTVDMIIHYHLALKNGDTKKDARSLAAKKAITSFSTKILSHVVTHQIARTTLMKHLMKPSLFVASRMPNVLRNSIAITVGSTPGTIASVAASAKLIQAGVVSTTITTVVLSLGDLNRYFSNEMSGKTLIRNISIRAGSVVAAAAGSTIGRAILGFFGFFNPLLGFIGGCIGGIIGSVIGGNSVKTLVDLISPNQESYFKDLINDQLSKACKKFDVSIEDLENIIMPKLKNLNYENLMFNMEKAMEPERYACSFATGLITESLSSRNENISRLGAVT